VDQAQIERPRVRWTRRSTQPTPPRISSADDSRCGSLVRAFLETRSRRCHPLRSRPLTSVALNGIRRLAQAVMQPSIRESTSKARHESNESLHHFLLWRSSRPAPFRMRATGRADAILSFEISLCANPLPRLSQAFQPWFGDPGHIQIHYTSNDPSVIRNRSSRLRPWGFTRSRSIGTGPVIPFLDRSYALIQKIASEDHFHVALMYDETEEDDGIATEDALEAMDLAHQQYIGPSATGREVVLAS